MSAPRGPPALPVLGFVWEAGPAACPERALLEAPQGFVFALFLFTELTATFTGNLFYST